MNILSLNPPNIIHLYIFLIIKIMCQRVHFVLLTLQVLMQQNGQVKHTQTICCQKLTNYLSVFDHFVGLALKGLRNKINLFK